MRRQFGITFNEVWARLLDSVSGQILPPQRTQQRTRTKMLETVVMGTDYSCTLAAYEKARSVYPRDRLTFRHGIRLIRERMPDGSERS